MKYSIVEAAEEDLKKCAEIAVIPELQIPDGSYPPYEYLKKVYKSEMFLVGKKGEEVVGFLLAHILAGGASFLDLLVVSPTHRDQGLGHDLIQEYKKKLKDKKIHYIFFFASEANKKTINFYLKEGFIKAKHKYEFFCMNI